MNDLLKYFSFVKADESKRMVMGVIACEEPDRSGEILDYKSSKPHFVKWFQSQLSDTKGKSYGNVRRMHQLDAVGKLVRVWFDDKAKKIWAVAKITDPRTWNDVLEGVLAGFSIGGKYVARAADDARRYTAGPFEVSLVDRSCIPGAAGLEVVKSDGSTEVIKFESSVEQTTERDLAELPRQGTVGEDASWGDLEAAPTDPFCEDSPQNERRSGVQQDKGGEDDPYLERADKKPYGDVEYADPGYQSDKKKRYPIDTEEHIRAAWSYINKESNASKYSSEQLSHIKGKIKAAMKRIGAEVGKSEITEGIDVWDNEFEELIVSELNKTIEDLDKGLRKRATDRVKEIRDMYKTHFTAMDSALDGLAKGIAGANSPETEGNPMQSRSGEIVSQPKPAISFNPQEPTSIGKLAKRLGVPEEKLAKAVEEVNSGNSGLTAEDVHEIVQKSMMDVFEKMFGSPATSGSDAVRGASHPAVRTVSKEQDAAEVASKAADAAEELPPPPGLDPRMQEIYKHGKALKAQGEGEMDEGIQVGLSKVRR